MTRRRYPRSSCVVPFCSRTSTLFAGEWICADHWRMADRELRQLRTRLIRRWKRRGWWEDERRLPAINRALDGWWARLKRQAIERAVAIA